MLSNLREIFDKKSPIFLIAIILFLSTIIALTFPAPSSTCSYQSSINLFQIALLVVFGCEILVKTIGINLIHYCSESGANLPHSIAIVGFLIIDLAMWVIGCLLYWKMKDEFECTTYQPHHFMLEVYVCVGGIIFLTVFSILILLKLENKVITVFDRSSRGEQA